MDARWAILVGFGFASACGGDSFSFDNTKATGGTSADASVGGAHATGGGSSTGGAGTSTGGRTASGGGQGEATGGAGGIGGTSTGGGNASGGAGGASSAGASGASSGGAGGTATGGASTGGAATGGTRATGGAATGGGDAGSVVTHPNCASWKQSGVHTDGIRSVDPDGTGPLKAFEVYCAGMTDASPARDYLELPHNEDDGWPGKNIATFAHVGSDNCTCTSNLTSHFDKVLMRTGDLTLLSADRTFATFDSDPTCYINDPTCDGEKIGYGDGEDCRGIGAAGTANIDLGGTPFHIGTAAVFVEFGYLGNGSVTISVDRKQATVTGGGYCGGYGPRNGELALEQD